MSVDEIHVNDIGTVLRVTMKDGEDIEDISAATTKHFIFTKPSGTRITRAAGFVTDGSDGRLQYVTIAGDLDEDGPWKIQVYLVLPAWNGSSDVGTFLVHRNI